MKKENKRREFLKNVSLTALSAGFLPTLLKATPEDKSKPAICNETTLDRYGQGPFYTPNAPTIQENKLTDDNEQGTKLIISGRVLNLDCSQVIPNAVLDLWHANDAGDYDRVGYNLRGKTTTNNEGFYIFETIKPGPYLIDPNTNTFRPSHIHIKITPPGFPELTTQLYFEGDPHIATDVAASITSGTFDATSRIIPLTQNNQGDLEGTWDIVIDGNGIALGIDNLQGQKGLIYKSHPNPFKEKLEINYGVFQKSKVSLMVFDLQGRIVAKLEEKTMKPDKYTAIWKPETNLPNGHYFIGLKINDLQVHYLKVIKESY